MDYIKRRISDFESSILNHGITNSKTLISNVRELIHSIDSDKDKVQILNSILEANNRKFQKHLVECTDKDKCPKNLTHLEVEYFLKQELQAIGILIDNDAFTTTEKHEYLAELNSMIESISELKAGQQVLFEELQEMRDLFFLGKKKWHQLLVGKSLEMVASGVVAESSAKEIIKGFKEISGRLLT